MGVQTAFFTVVFACFSLIAAPEAAARVEDVRVGVSAHNVLDDEDKEGGANVETDIVFSSPRALKIIGGPRPFATASVNTQGDTSAIAAGLSWRVPLGARWAIAPELALAAHNGEADDADAGGRRVLYGSRIVFRSAIAVERRINERFAAQVFAAHYSNGGLFGSDRNQGSESVGVRLVIRMR
ncbi:MAG: acyloxyacyl hydrolase [Hyphomonadaceae bacterium]